MRKNKQPTRDYNPETKIRFHPEDNSYLTAGEFVRRIKENGIYGDKDVERTFEILIESCKTGPLDEVKVARLILEEAGFTWPIIPIEAYIPNITDHHVLRHYQLWPGMLVRNIEMVKRIIKQEKNKAFKLIFKRDMTQEERQALRKKGFKNKALFFFACGNGLNFTTLKKLYYSEEAKQERKEIEALNDPYALTSREKKYLEEKNRLLLRCKL